MNVPRTANGDANHTSLAHAAAAAKFLFETISDHVVCEDDKDEIFGEWKAALSMSGQPGPGDRFFMWFMKNRFTDRCLRVDIVESEWLPDSLNSFDEDDQKYIKVYFASSADYIANAVDGDYSESADDLKAESVVVREVCAGVP